jgi:alkylation response protein AidB-like acyl-CoA dehydrogenase
MTTHPRSVGEVGVLDDTDSLLDPEVSGETSTLPALQRLARAGLVDLGVDRPAELVSQFEVISRLAERSLSIAFSAWSHRMVIQYVSVDSSPFRRRLRRQLSAGDLIGSTAMAPALRAHLGLGAVGLTGTRDGNALVVDGSIAWASNLYPECAVIVAAVEIAPAGRAVVALTPDIAGVVPHPFPELLALNATRSSSLEISGARIPSTHILSWDLPAFLALVRPVFLLLQTAFCVGLAEGSLQYLEGEQTGAATVLLGDLATFVTDHDRLRRRAFEAATQLRAPVVELIRLRLEAAALAQRAVALEARLAGGRGYLARSGVSRRYREAAFLPIQSPTEAQLRWELSCFE